MAEMSIFTDEIISREADNIRDIISGAISIFISQRQQRQPTNIIKPHSRAFSRGSLGQLNICRDRQSSVGGLLDTSHRSV